MTWRQKNQSTEALHPFVAIEEPETHLHPQSQRALFQHLGRLPGQRIISTHSPYVCSQADIDSFVHFFKEGNETTVSRFYDNNEEQLDSESVRKIKRQVMNTRGDLLFSRCVVLFEGETEEQALPSFAQYYWGKHPNDLGVTFVSVDGSGNYLPFLRLTTRFHIPWVVFSDGEDKAIADLDNALDKAGQPCSANNPRCVVIPDKKSFEQYLTTSDSLDALQLMMADFHIELSNTTDEQGMSGIRESWKRKDEAAILEQLKLHKTRYGARIADAFQTIGDEDIRTPNKIKDALDLAVPPAPEANGDDGNA